LRYLSRQGATDDHPLFAQRAVKRRLIIVIAADKGLAGAYNSNVLKRYVQLLRDDDAAGIDNTTIAVGRKAAQFVARLKDTQVVGVYEDVPDRPTGPAFRAILDTAHDMFVSKQVDAVDVNERALALTRMNAERARVADRVRTFSPDDAVYDEIWSNPPIRIGKKALHELLLTWLPRLKPNGTAYLVVSKNLGADSLTTWLTEQEWPTEKLASAKGFRVLKVRRGGDSPN